MWSHYADYHKGFVLGYPCENLPSQDMKTNHCALFPVIYSDEDTMERTYWDGQFIIL